ncbi:MAG: hypothetical protein HY200_02250 [Nitrospirae bacterium]|nr:hypothetical protein [Nitrospirota bacterium]
MSQFVPVGKVPYHQMVELLVPFLGDIQPDLMIIGNKIQIHSDDFPFMLAINKAEKRLGIIEILAPSKDFPAQILAHAAWVEKNGNAIANLNKNDFNPQRPPFILGLTPSYPEWQAFLSYLKFDIRLFKYTAMTYQGSPVLIFDSLFEPDLTVNKQDLPPVSPQPISSSLTSPVQLSKRDRPVSGPPAFHDEGIYEERVTELTDDEIRYFSN